jgi:hypothetical protein
MMTDRTGAAAIFTVGFLFAGLAGCRGSVRSGAGRKKGGQSTRARAPQKSRPSVENGGQRREKAVPTRKGARKTSRLAPRPTVAATRGGAEARSRKKPADVARKSQSIHPPSAAKARKMYPWKRKNAKYTPLSLRLAPPPGYRRVGQAVGTYGHWLRHLPVRRRSSKVHDYTGRVLPGSTSVSAAVIDLNVPPKDRQQCIDTILRLRAEYLWWKNKKGKIKFRYAGGKYFGWSHWRKGLLPRRKRGRTVFVKRRSGRSGSRKSFAAYLSYMFAMTGTMHHVREPRVTFDKMQPGDFFINPPPRSGALGHAVVILDLARRQDGAIAALIGEGYTPAQDFHVLKTPKGKRWYRLDPRRPVSTPQWPHPFKWKDLARFRH